MAQWHHTLKLKDLLDGDDDPEHVRDIALTIHNRMQAARDKINTNLSMRLGADYVDMDEYDSIEDEFHSIAVMTTATGGGDLNWFNSLLDNLYDWADDHRVWIG